MPPKLMEDLRGEGKGPRQDFYGKKDDSRKLCLPEKPTQSEVLRDLYCKRQI